MSVSYTHLVAEGKSVKKASEKLKISSPAISQALKLLEEDLGTELFCREVRPLRLTASGRKLQTEGINLLEAARSLRNKICSNEYVFQSLRLGIGESATSTIGPYLLALLRNKVSEISMESLLTAPLVEKLLKDEIDVLISVDPVSYTHLDVYKRQMWRRAPEQRRTMCRARLHRDGA